MPVNQTIASLSQTPAQNGPLGIDPPSALDDSMRFGLSFIAQLRDGDGFKAGAIPKALGFTPIQQGTGIGQAASIVKIGWADGLLRVQVDDTNFAGVWPIGISGNASSATNATNAATANYANTAGSANSATNANYATNAGNANTANSATSAGNAATAGVAANANALGGRAVGEFVRRVSTNEFALGWDGARINGFVDGGNQVFRTNWANVDGRPTDLASFSNGPGYVTRYGNALVDVGAPDNSGVVGRAIPNTDFRIGYINVIPGGLGVIVDGAAYSWGINASDERLKENIRPTTEDSISKIQALEFKAFDFKPSAKLFAGISRKSSLTAQQAESVDPDWVTNHGDYKQLNLETILTSVAHALQQALIRIEELERKR